jgi:hypothetical protein
VCRSWRHLEPVSSGFDCFGRTAILQERLQHDGDGKSRKRFESETVNQDIEWNEVKEIETVTLITGLIVAFIMSKLLLK